jgi:hypothetical protein
MPARKLEAYVNQGLKLGMGIEASAVAETIYAVASRPPGEGGRIPLHLPLGGVAWKLARTKFEGLLAEFDNVKEVSFMGEE